MVGACLTNAGCLVLWGRSAAMEKAAIAGIGTGWAFRDAGVFTEWRAVWVITKGGWRGRQPRRPGRARSRATESLRLMSQATGNCLVRRCGHP